MTRIPRKARAALVVGLVAVLVGAPAGVGYAAYQNDAAVHGVAPRHTVVGGVDVSGLTEAAAVAKVRAVVERDWDRVAGVTVAGHTYTATLRSLGARNDVPAAVAKAFREARSGSWVTRAWHKAVDGSSAPHVDVTVVDHDPAKVAALVHRAAQEVAVAPVDAGVRLADGMLAFSHAKDGRALDETAARAAVEAALREGGVREVAPTVVPPKVRGIATAILVRTGENTLYLYQHGKITRTYRVATGSPRYPTPVGQFRVELKRYLPTWRNPHSEWSRYEPEVIPPGPNNPLGTRALNLSAPGIRIHGTPADRSIGYSVSHGCIRMHMWDVEALYPLVPTGTPVFITRAGAARLGGASTGTANAADGG